ncbi:MAG: ABC transporter permease [Emergencia sp.]
MKLLNKIDKKYVLTLVICIAVALLCGALIMLITGFNPIKAYQTIITGALGRPRLIGNTLEKFMTLCLLGLATAIGAKGGLFNVGGEGQLFVGALVSTMVGLQLSSLPAPIVIVIAFISAVVVGGFYAWIPAMLKVKLNVSEVITTIMLNTVAIKVVTYLVNGPWCSDLVSVSKGTDYLPDSLRLTKLIAASNLSTSFIVGAIFTFLIWYFMKMTTAGLQMRMTGENARFARFAGLKSDRIMVASMVASGAICGFVGMTLVYGYNGQMVDTISTEFYFDGMLVAMIMNYNPVGIIIMSGFFAILNTGATMMDMTMGISTQIYDIIFSILIFLMAANKGFVEWFNNRKMRKQARAIAKKKAGKESI